MHAIVMPRIATKYTGLFFDVAHTASIVTAT